MPAAWTDLLVLNQPFFEALAATELGTVRAHQRVLHPAEADQAAEEFVYFLLFGLFLAGLAAHHLIFLFFIVRQMLLQRALQLSSLHFFDFIF